MVPKTNNLRVKKTELMAPNKLYGRYPATEAGERTIDTARKAIIDIMKGRDKRKLFVIGPCSIHDLRSAIYAEKLIALQKRVAKTILIVMRAVFEKPRTTIGWKGFVHNPHLDDRDDMEYGITHAYKFLRDLNQRGMPAAAEFLGPSIASYLGRQYSLYWIGARTVESQTHRENASGLSAPVFMKNLAIGTAREGIDQAVNAMIAAREKHAFLGIDEYGRSCIIRTDGNPFTGIILRGNSHPNDKREYIEYARNKQRAAGFPEAVMVDCSHMNAVNGNGQKDANAQLAVGQNVVRLMQGGEAGLVGLMLESNILFGKQRYAPGKTDCDYSLSLTDECIGWEETEQFVLRAHDQLA